jgi:hypothetical protein
VVRCRVQLVEELALDREVEVRDGAHAAVE